MSVTTQEQQAAATAPPRRRRGLWVLGAVAVAAALVAVIALLGGFNDVPIEKLPVIELGDTHSGNEVDTRITGTYLTKQQPGYTFDADAGMQYFVVEATLLNTQDTTEVIDTGLVRVLLGDEIAPADDPDGVVKAGTAFSLDFLQPGLEVRALYFWLIPDTVAEGDDVVVGVFERHLVDDPRYGGAVYSSGEPMARVITTIGERG
ncbi:hypothetical protein BH09ACT5_BH09ACT5_12640 [soil metagenome]